MKSMGQVERNRDALWQLRELTREVRALRRRFPRRARWLLPAFKREVRRRGLVVSRVSWY